MTGYSPAALKSVHPFVKQYVPSAFDSGVYVNKPGYHNCRANLPKTDYSVQDPRDKAGDPNAGRAFDLRMSDVDMRKVSARIKAAVERRDPRLVGRLREYGGTLDSKNVYAVRVEDNHRIPFDKTHLWHGHWSVFTIHANDFEVARGIAEVICGIEAQPYVWDGKSFPGASRFYVGAEGPWVTHLGERLVAHGWTGYTSGPGPTFTEVDRAAVKWAQEKQGFSGRDADGFPGATTWDWLEKDPEGPISPSHPESYPTPSTRDVYLEKLVPGQTDSDSVWQLQNALRALGFDCQLTGDYDSQTIEAAKRYQRSLGDKNVDGIVGRLQTNRVFKDAKVSVNVILPDQPSAGDPGPERMTLSLRDWSGPAGRTFIQGWLIHEPSGTSIVHQADDVEGQSEQDVVLRFHDDLTDGYRGYIRIKGAGHGSTLGLEPLGDRKFRVWMKHATGGYTGYLEVEVNDASYPTVSGIRTLIRCKGLPAGDVSIDKDENLLVVRRGDTFEGFLLDSCVVGAPKQAFDKFTIPNWGARFQGFLAFGKEIRVHRDVATRGASRAHRFDQKGNKLGWLDTTNMGDEAEGFLRFRGRARIVKRTGNNTPGRIVEARLVNESSWRTTKET